MTHEYYIASRWRNKDAVLELTRKMREEGKSVYCFIEGDGTPHELKNTQESQDPELFAQYFESIPDWKHNAGVREVFDIDMQAVRDSEKLILLLSAGKSAHIEAGAAYGMGKKCILIGEQKETESLYLIFSEFYDSIDEFIASISYV